MNTKNISIVVALLAIAAGVYVVVGSRSGGNNNAGGAGTPAQAGAFEGSLFDLSARGGEWKCTVSAQSNTGAGSVVSAGTVYVSGTKVRGDFSSTVPGVGEVEAHMIADGEYVYSWTSLLPQGIKTAMAATAGSGSATPSGQGMDANQRYAYDCVPSPADASLFAPPASVSFQTL